VCLALACSKKEEEPVAPPPAEPVVTPVEVDRPPVAPEEPAEPAPAEPAPPPPPAVPRLVYMQRGIWVANLDGTGGRRVSDAFYAEISPDGRKLAWSDEGGAIGILDLDSGTSTPLELPAGTTGRHPRWAANGTTLVLGTSEPGDAVIGADGTGFRVVGTPEQCDDSAPGHDGTYLVCVDTETLWEIALDGTIRAQIPLADFFGGRTPRPDHPDRVVVSPDGTKLVFDLWTPSERYPDLPAGLGGIYVVDRASKATRRVTTEELHALHPSWLADGTLVFQAVPVDARLLRALGDDAGIRYSVYHANADGTEARVLVQNAERPSASGP
jgi:hypothetical protein